MIWLWGLKLLANIRSFRKTSVLTISASLTHTHIYSVSTTIFGESHIFGAGYPIQWNTGKSVLWHSFQSSPINHQPSTPRKPTIKLTIIYQPKNTISPWSEQVKNNEKTEKSWFNPPRNGRFFMGNAPPSFATESPSSDAKGERPKCAKPRTSEDRSIWEWRTTSWRWSLGIFNHILMEVYYNYYQY